MEARKYFGREEIFQHLLLRKDEGESNQSNCVLTTLGLIMKLSSLTLAKLVTMSHITIVGIGKESL